MKLLDFLQAVRNMRQAQKDYFRYRNQSKLIAAKQHEAIVDKALAEGISFVATTRSADEIAVQVSLFGEDDHEEQ